MFFEINEILILSGFLKSSCFISDKKDLVQLTSWCVEENLAPSRIQMLFVQVALQIPSIG